MTLPPKPPPHDPDAPSQSEPGVPSAQGTLAHPAYPGFLGQERNGRLVVPRALLLALSGLGMTAAGLLWATGHPALAARLLAGDVLLIFVVLLAL